jgi:hypothetical protein
MPGQHKRLSASGAERYIECSASITMFERLFPDYNSDDDEEEWSAEGTCAHEGAAKCLIEGLDGWEVIGEKLYKDIEFNDEMSIGVQEYIDYVRQMSEGANRDVEITVDNMSVHKDFGGSTDCCIHNLVRSKDGLQMSGFVHIIDFKYGAGIAREPDDPQLKYYAFGAILNLATLGELDPETNVGLTIVQPRAFHKDGTIREKWMTVKEIVSWAEETLIPAMHAVDGPNPNLKAGEWCRFCPGKIACPALHGAFKAMMNADPRKAQTLTNEQLALEKEAFEVVKMYGKALDKEVYARIQKGQKVPGFALGPKRADRVFKDKQEIKGKEIKFKDAAAKAFGDKAFQDRKYLTPPNMEKLPGGSKFVKQWAYKPYNGDTVVKDDGSRQTTKVETHVEAFKGVKKA